MDGENSVPSCALFRPLLNTELVERSLLELLNEVPDSVVLRVVFFGKLERLLAARSPSLALALLVLKRHLTRAASQLPHLKIDEFADWKPSAAPTALTDAAPAPDHLPASSPFAALLAATRPSVFLMDSGKFWLDASAGSGREKALGGAPEGSAAPMMAGRGGASAALLMHYVDLQLFFLGHVAVPVAYTDGLRDLVGYIETPLFSGRAKELGKRLSALLRMPSLEEAAPAIPGGDPNAAAAARVLAAVRATLGESARVRLALVASALVPADDQPLAALACLATMALDALKLDERSQAYALFTASPAAAAALQSACPQGVTGPAERVLSAFLERTWAPALVAALDLIESDAESDAAPVDLGPEPLDGLLLARLAAVLAQGHVLALSPALEDRATRALALAGLALPSSWAAVPAPPAPPSVPHEAKARYAAHSADGAGRVEAGPGRTTAGRTTKQKRSAWAPRTADSALLPLPPLVASVTRGLFEEPAAVAALIASDGAPEAASLRDVRHWHSARLILDPLATTKDFEGTQQERPWVLRNGTPMNAEQIARALLKRKQKEALFIQKLAESQKCAHFSHPIVPSKLPWEAAPPAVPSAAKGVASAASALKSESKAGGKAKPPSKKDLIIQQNTKAKEARVATREVDALASALLPRIHRLRKEGLDFSADLKALEQRVLSDPNPLTVAAVVEPLLTIMLQHLKDLATEAGVDDVAASAAAAKDRRLGAMAGRALHVADQGFTRGLAVLTSDPATRDQARADLKRLMDREGGGVYYSLFKFLRFRTHFKMLKKEMDTLLGKRADAAEEDEEEGGGRVASRPDLFLQMREMGPFLKRDVEEAPDPRVPFTPDAWQRDLLDAIDARKSALVVAPTSAGKTFSCYYIMEKLLRHSPPKDMVVYVAPTKALVNQVAAEVQARFKSYQPLGSEVVVGVFTREWRREAENCRVLVTIAQCLDIMLMHPEHGPGYNRRIQYVIFDEVHNVAEEGTGEVLQRLLQLSNAPFLALSATVGHPEVFHGWLQDVSKGRRDVLLVQEHKRWVQSMTWTYAPPSEAGAGAGAGRAQSLGVLTGKGDGLERAVPEQQRRLRDELHPTHPLACVPAAQFPTLLQQSGALSLNPAEILALWEAMAGVAGAGNPEIADLAPERFFAGVRMLDRRVCGAYARALMARLRQWQEREDAAWFGAVIARLAAPLDAAFAGVEGRGGESSEPRVFLGREVPELLVTLKNAAMLPAIVFHFAKQGCEALALAVYQRLKQETALSPDMAREVRRRLADAEVEASTLAGQCRDLAGSVRPSEVAERERLETLLAEQRSKILMLEAKLRGATLNPQGVDMSEHAWVREALERKGPRFNVLLNALEFGVGVHHAGLPKKYTDLVELLFRERRLKVVVATGTLSQGVNMPARTVVLAGDSMFLTPSMFRQTAGRAGRRGMDNEAHVVFLGLPRAKVERLVGSSLTALRARAPVQISTVLRLCVQASAQQTGPAARRANDREVAAQVASLARVIRQPFTGGDDPARARLNVHQFLYGVRYLKEAGLLTATCEASNISYLASHIHYHGEGAFLFCRLLESGVLDQLASLPLPDDLLSGCLVHLLALLFNRIEASPFVLTRLLQSPEDTALRGSSLIVLPGLKDFASFWEGQVRGFQDAFQDAGLASMEHVLEAYNGHLQGLLVEYLGDIGSEPIDRYDLPLSGLALELAVPSTCILSPVAAAQGVADLEGALASGIDAHTLLELARHSIPMQASFLPMFDRMSAQSAFLFDFYRNGSLENLVQYNGVSEYVAWELIKDAHLLLLSLAASLEHVRDAAKEAGDPLPERAKRLVRLMRGAATTFSIKFKESSDREGI